MEPIVVDPKQTKDETENKMAEPTTALTPDSPAVPPTPTAPVAGSLPPKKSRKNLLLIVALLLLAVVGGVFAYMKVNKLAKPAVTADQSQKEVAELRIGSDQFPFSGFYPDPNFAFGGSYPVNFQLYEGLVGFEDASKHVPLLAESWTNPDDLTWVFKIKQGVKFHNGQTMTAEDVRRSIDNAVKDENMIQLLVDTIESVAVQDDDHVVIKTKAPDAILLNKLPFLFIQAEDQLNGAPVGTGAYTLEAAPAEDGKELRLVAFDDHHLGKPAVRKVVFLGFEGEEAVQQAVKDGKIDVTDYLTKTGGTAPDVAGYNKPTFDLGDITFVGISTDYQTSSVRKLAVRQALKLAIDPAAYIKEAGRTGKVPTQMTTQQNFGYNPDLPVPTRDVAKAKALLKEAGYPNGVSIKLHYYNSEGNVKTYEILKAQLAEAGIKLVDDGGDADDVPFAKIDEGNSELYLLTSTSVLIDSYDLFAFNFRNANFDNATLNDLLDKSNAEFDGAKRKQLLQDASKVIVDEVAAIPLVENISAYYVRDNLNLETDIVGYAVAGYIRNISAK